MFKMRYKIRALICLILFALMFSGAEADGFTTDGDKIEEAAKSVLKLYVYDSGNADLNDYYATGSGFVAFDNSTLITNYHVIDGAEMIIAMDDQDYVYNLKYVMCADQVYDIAILAFEKPTSLKPLELYPDDKLKRGSSIIAIGSPKETKNTVSRGIISNTYYYNDVPEIQIDAAISPGSSGGALFNDDGKVIGVTSSGYRTKDEYGQDTQAQNINFAINSAVPQAMYNAWDGIRHTLSDHIDTAEMDFSNVYDHQTGMTDISEIKKAEEPVQSVENWTCPKCGRINTERFCLECGTEKPSWICACGKENSAKFCGRCGRKAEDLVQQFNQAIEYAENESFGEAVDSLEKLAFFNSGSYETIRGTHTSAKESLAEVYYLQGLYLMSVNGDHETILNCFISAGDYADAHDQITNENNRYYSAFYHQGIAEMEKGNYEAAIQSFIRAENYSDAKQKLSIAYYMYGISLLENKKYAESRNAFMNAENYSDSAEMILKSYYEEGIEAYQRKEYGIAKKLFISASGYKDSHQIIIQIEKDENDEIYRQAVALYNTGNFNEAKDKFEKISDHNDTATYLKLIEIRILEKEMGACEEIKDVNLLSSYASKIEPYLDLEDAQKLYKRIQYYIGILYFPTDFVASMNAFEAADDYLDAEVKLMEVKTQYFESLLSEQKYQTASEFLHEKLLPYGYDKDCFLMQPGDSGKIPSLVLTLAKIIGVKEKIPRGEDCYKDDYIASVKEFEKHFGMDGDGKLTLDEYLIIEDCIYPGLQDPKVKSLVEKLSDLSYIKKLGEKDHDIYANHYVNSIKQVEKDLGVTEDGVITHDEYEIILNQKVEISMPKNIKATSNKDKVTITWSAVPGAVKYQIYRTYPVRKYLGETYDCKWVQEENGQGGIRGYGVSALKYTAKSEKTTIKIDVPKYYKPVSYDTLVNREPGKYENKYVELKNLIYYDWRVGKDFDFKESYSDLLAVKTGNGDLYLVVGKTADQLLLLVICNYSSWGWNNDNDLIMDAYNNRIKRVTVKGQYDGSQPILTVHEISWTR